jgi:cytochrome c oxidase assembly protein subunit 15
VSAAVVRRVLLANLVAQVGIVVTGGLVRLTGSGLGCPSWPECVPGSYVPVLRQPQGFHKYIEFSNRMVTLAVLVAAAAALLVTIRSTPPGERRRRRGRLLLGAVPLLGVVTQAMLGGLTVLTGLNPATVAAHFLLSMVLIAASSLLLLRVGLARPPTGHLPRELAWLGRGIAAVLALVLVLGTVVTGSGPHSGDAARPARFGLDPRSVSWVHADVVWLFLGLVVTLVIALRLAGAPTSLRRRAWWLLAATLAQAVIGYTQYFTGLPVPIVSLHLLGASLLVVAVTFAVEPLVSRDVAAADHGRNVGFGAQAQQILHDHQG